MHCSLLNGSVCFDSVLPQITIAVVKAVPLINRSLGKTVLLILSRNSKVNRLSNYPHYPYPLTSPLLSYPYPATPIPYPTLHQLPPSPTHNQFQSSFTFSASLFSLSYSVWPLFLLEVRLSYEPVGPSVGRLVRWLVGWFLHPLASYPHSSTTPSLPLPHTSPLLSRIHYHHTTFLQRHQII